MALTNEEKNLLTKNIKPLKMRTFIYGTHFSGSKELVFRISKRKSRVGANSVNVGDSVFVQTKKGKAPLLVTRVVKSTVFPINDYVNIVLYKLSKPFQFKEHQKASIMNDKNIMNTKD